MRRVLEALHPRGVREKELSRVLARFLDLAKESCLKVRPPVPSASDVGRPRVSVLTWCTVQ